MSYAGKVSRDRSSVLPGARRGVGDGERAGPLRAETRSRRPETEESELDWKHIAIFAAGVAVGLTVGAGLALLTAPQSGRATRRDIAKRGRRIRRRSADAWDDLRHELRAAARRGRRSLARSLAQSVKRRRGGDDQPDPIEET